ncbi:ABC transporter ATP-binding protein [Schinkia azotoformans]|nr:ABC transporter ATP-binding protein [Schinkia azotoformans]MEC1694522.1 ABC transporter ATP-binding protein [Schinkia azotoformans]MEC1716544.1 ABC transporter ATP-binding protein [Schinkia azotoformans]MEC1725256.1 ABC transporter ATP-binding protein [Schinkia azotoformans]MEC1744234.1 ABC transporter ATP-binding protein [Schinkia azotoformans]MEC1760345.1 ABC transporter ATP-binding protein [Schinkia azotoformans]
MMISLKNVSKILDEKLVLENINWDIHTGENWVLFGLNGSGKTTLLSIITGYLWTSSGKVTVLGKEFGKYPLYELRKQIGIVSSAIDNLMPSYDYAENIVLSGKYASFGLHEDPNQDDIDYALSIMERFRCTDLIHRTFETLSQGQKQKVMIMRALMAKPKLLILDEPCAGLDVLAREQVLEFINTLGDDPEAPSMLYVTHHVEEILPAFKYITLLRAGQIFAKGTINNILTDQIFSEFLGRDVKIDQFNHRNYLKFV